MFTVETRFQSLGLEQLKEYIEDRYPHEHAHADHERPHGELAPEQG